LAEPTWADRLARGDRLRPHRTSAVHVVLTVLTVGAGTILWVWIRMLTSLYGRAPDPLLPHDIGGTMAFIVIGAIWVFVLVPLVWGLRVNTAVQFLHDEFRFWDWRGRVHAVPYDNVMALFRRFDALATGKWGLRVRHKTAASERVLNLWTDLGWIARESEAVMDEIVQRCGLGKSRDRGPLGDEMWVREDG